MPSSRTVGEAMPGRRRPVALVTGARRGIGRGIAYALAERGFDVVLADLITDTSAEETAAGIRARGGKAAVVESDIADLSRHQALLDAAWSVFGTLDCLVNNAGVTVARRGDLLDASPDSFDRVLAVNLRGTFFLTQKAARRMAAESRAGGDPPRSIITISSINALVPAPERAEYCLSKTALSMMTKLFALRLAPHGIAVYEVRPGIIRTDMTAVVRDKYDRLIAGGVPPIARWGESEDVGHAVATLASGAIPFATGDTYHIDGGLHLPRL